MEGEHTFQPILLKGCHRVAIQVLWSHVEHITNKELLLVTNGLRLAISFDIFHCARGLIVAVTLFFSFFFLLLHSFSKG